MKDYIEKKLKNKEKMSLIQSIKQFVLKYKMHILYLLIVILSIISIVVQAIDRKNTLQVNDINVNKKDNKIAVYITGAVKNPGVYYLEENSRLSNLLDVCGGINQDADIEQINLAKKLVDSDKINIPVKQEKTDENYETAENEETGSNKENKININNASEEELMQLNGIGKSTATKIIEYRKIQKFLEIEDIMNVSGIGQAKFEKIKEDITV